MELRARDDDGIRPTSIIQITAAQHHNALVRRRVSLRRMQQIDMLLIRHRIGLRRFGPVAGKDHREERASHGFRERVPNANSGQ